VGTSTVIVLVVMLVVAIAVLGPVMARSFNQVKTERVAANTPPETGQIWDSHGDRVSLRVEILEAKKSQVTLVVGHFVRMKVTRWVPGTDFHEETLESKTFDPLAWISFISHNDLRLTNR